MPCQAGVPLSGCCVHVREEEVKRERKREGMWKKKLLHP
jgi:hypothetical protein